MFGTSRSISASHQSWNDSLTQRVAAASCGKNLGKSSSQLVLQSQSYFSYLVYENVKKTNMYVVCAKMLIGLSNSSTLFWLFFTSMNESNWEATLLAKVDITSQKLGCTQAWQTQFTAFWRTFLLCSYVTVHMRKPTKLQSLLPRHVLTAPVWGVIVVACHGKNGTSNNLWLKINPKNRYITQKSGFQTKSSSDFLLGWGPDFLLGTFLGLIRICMRQTKGAKNVNMEFRHVGS